MRALSLGKPAQIFVLVIAAMLEVGGDALIRRGLRASGAAFVVLGFVVLGTYGIVVNLLDLDFSRLLGIYVGVFALVSVLAGRFLFAEQIAPATWIGLCVVLTGSAIIQFGVSSR
jgi:small multidrug resistance family-3 protein